MGETVPRSCRIAVVILAVLSATGVARAKPSDPTVVRHELLGRSALDRPIHVVEVGDPDDMRKVLVVGCIHGDEPQGIRIAQALERQADQAREAPFEVQVASRLVHEPVWLVKPDRDDGT